MTKGKYVFLLVLAAIISETAYSQSIEYLIGTKVPYHSVPDSLTCITPAQDVFFIGQSFTIKSLQTTIALKNKEINNHIAIEDFKDKQLSECHEQVKLNINQFSNCQVDKKIESDKVELLEKKSKIQKLLLYITVPLACIETSILGALYIIKKVP